MGKRTNTAVWMDKYQRWQIKVQKDGERKTFSSSMPGRNGQREANAKADAWLDGGVDSGRLRMSNLCDGYIDDLKIRTSQSHWRPEQCRIETWIKPAIGTLKPERVTEQNCQDIVNAAYAKGLSRKTIKNLRATIVALFKYCRKRKVCTFRPEELEIPRGAVCKQKTVLQPKELVTLFTVDTTLRYSKRVPDPYINFYRFAVVTGYRPGEILGLMPNDLRDNVLKVNRSINIYGEVTPGKNDNARRSQALTPLSKAIWDSQIQQMEGLYVFGTVQEETILKRWKKYCEANGITTVTLYELRHTFVSVIQSLPEAYIKTLVGHSDAMDTQTYTHLLDDTQQNIANEVQRIFDAILNVKPTEQCQNS